MVVGEASIHNIMGGMESTGGVRLHNHKRKLKQRFDIIKKLGQGTYGKVQLGINKETGQEVAIKTIKKCKIETEADLIRIRREIQIMSSVQHPNIIHIYEVFENREKMVLVMEYAAGGELYDYLSERKVLSELEARRIFRQISTAVFYCHKHKICHRDLKLENILLDQVGNAKIADFGLSNVFDEQRLLSTFCGSPLYASPEIVKGTPYHGPEVDCWSLGVLLYTLVYGAMPFDGSNFKRLVKQISQSDYFEPKVPSPASPLIKEMLTVCPTRRADIEKICTHWWVNEGYEQNCLDIAEELAAQTPVRLDLLLSLVPQSASAEKLLVGDQQGAGDVANNMSSETLVPTRCHSVGSLMELDQNNSDRRIREMFEEEPRTAASGDAKRKLETTPSMDETAATGVKRKERSRRKERSDEREPRTYRSGSRHHSAPIPNSITEEAMEVDPTITVPTSKTVDIKQLEGAAACLELIEECKEKSPSKERSKTPVPMEEKQPQLPTEAPAASGQAQDDKVESGAVKEVENKANVDSTEPSFTSVEPESEVPSKEEENRVERDRSVSHDLKKTDSIKELKKLKEKALSLDSELSNEPAEPPSKPVERRRSKIFETAEKFNQLASSTEPEKPKKIFIPGVNVGGAKRVFERKASLSSIGSPPTVKPNASKVIIDVPPDKKSEKEEKKEDAEASKRDEAKKRAVDIITGAIGKPPVQRKVNGSPPTSPPSQDPKKLGLKIQVAPNDIRTATVSVSTPVDTKFPFDGKSTGLEASLSSAPEITNLAEEHPGEPKMSSKMEITLKSATLPRPRKTSKAEITLSGVKPSEPVAFKSEVEAKIDAFHPQKLRTQRSEVAFPVAAVVPQTNRSSSLEPEVRPRAPKERIIPIQVEAGHQHAAHASTPPPKPPMPQRSMSQRSSSLSRQSTADSDTDSALGSTVGPEPIRKSPREYIIPIAVEGGGYVTPRSGSVEPESKTNTPTSTNPPRSRFTRPRRMSSLLSDASEDESPFSTLHRDSEDLLQRHMHRLRSSRPSRQPSEHADSLSSGEDDDDDGFELLTAENLFSTLLSRVRSLTQRLNVDDNRGSGFPSSRLLSRLGSNSPQTFWGLNKPLSRRLSESQFKHSLSRDGDLFSRKDSVSSSNPGTPSSPGTHGAPSRESVFEMGGSNTLPRDKVEHEDDDIAVAEADVASQIRKEAQETLEQSFTPSLARRLSRQFIEQTRQNSLPRERYGRSPTRESLSLVEASSADDRARKRHSDSTSSDRSEYRSRSMDRGIRRTNSLLETTTASRAAERGEHRSPRRSISLFEDDDRLLPPLPRQVMTLGRKYKEGRSSSVSRRENYHAYRADKIQEEPNDDSLYSYREADNADNVDNGSASECTSISICNSNTNIGDTVSSVSARSCETSSTESTSNVDYRPQYGKSEGRNFESRLLAAENLIKESKLRNLGPGKFNPNLTSSYKDTDKCDKETLGSISDPSAIMAKRRSCIPSLRLRSGSLTRESSIGADRRKSFSCSQDGLGMRGSTPERSILSKLFRSSSKDGESKDKDKEKEKAKPKQHRISRFLRPDFFDTPREESQYVKEKEAQKAAENERRKSRFMRKKNEAKSQAEADGKAEKELKNEMNSLKKDKSDVSSDDKSKKETCENPKLKFERQNSRSSFLHTLEKKLEKFRSGEEVSKVVVSNGSIPNDVKNRSLRENSAPPAESSSNELGPIKKTLSVEDLAPNKSSTTKSRVSSVLGLFKNNDKNNEKNDAKQNTNGARTQVILSKLKKSPPKMTKPESIEETPSTSKIPMKSVKSDPKLKKTESKKSPEKTLTDTKRSPPKERPKELLLREKKTSPEKILKESRKSNDKLIQAETSTSTADSSTGKDRVKVEPMKTDATKCAGEEIELKLVDNKQEVKGEEKKLTKTKKNISTLGKSASSAKSEDSGKKVVKTVKKEEGADGLKKKKIVRVVKKVVKKSSDSSESKSEEKEKSSKPLMKRISSTKKESSSETPASSGVPKTKENNIVEDSRIVPAPEVSTPSTENLKPVVENLPESDIKKGNLKVNDKPTAVEIVHSNASMNGTQAKTIDQRASRAGLKLDLSKIPQHTFRNTTPKRESPRTEEGTKSNVKSPSTSPKSTEPTDSNSEKLVDSLSKMSYHANITGNKIVIDKPLRAKDVAELKKEVTECARIIESHIEAQHELHAQQAKEDSNKVHAQRREDLNKINSQTRAESSKNISSQAIAEDTNKFQKNNVEPASKERSKECAEVKEAYKDLYKERPLDTTSELFSPTDEPESFDSWSICSADMNHTRGDLNSPTSPSSYSFYASGDQAESVIDRIRRRSFYSRFNDRKRASLTAPPPGVTLPSSSLSRKYSFNTPRERKSSYGSSGRRHEKYYDDLFRRSPVSKERCETSASPDLKSPADHYGSVSTSNYDTLRRYLRSPTLDVPTSRRRYHSSDFGSDELSSYRSPLSGSLLNDSPLHSYSGRSTLPRHYGSTVGSSEPKSVEYYEELLAPTTDYLSVRRASSVANDHPGRCENGYSNGNVDLQYGNEKRKSPYVDKARDEFTEDSEEEIGDKLRSTSERTNEVKDLPISPEPWSKTCTAE